MQVFKKLRFSEYSLGSCQCFIKFRAIHHGEYCDLWKGNY